MNPGERVGPYEILSRIGEGGMGAVESEKSLRLMQGRELSVACAGGFLSAEAGWGNFTFTGCFRGTQPAFRAPMRFASGRP